MTTITTMAPEVGDELETGGRTITEADLVSFAALTGDWHPQHTDADWAQRGRFGGRVAHGMLVISYAVGLVPIDPERVLALRGLDSVTFKRPVMIGDTISVHTRVERVRQLDSEHALVSSAWRVMNQHEQVVARATVDAIWRVSEVRPEPTNGVREAAALEGERVLL